jgi:hypothetical protein
LQVEWELWSICVRTAEKSLKLNQRSNLTHKTQISEFFNQL